MRVLITGFGPFLEHDHNPSLTLARALDGRRVAQVRLIAHAPLPVVYGVAGRRAVAAARTHGADAVVALGLAGKSRCVRVEACAQNGRTSPKPDATGATGRGRPVIPGAPGRLLATLHPEPVHRALWAAGVLTERSRDAGGYVCNDVYYHLLHAGLPALFVHVPPDVDVARLARPLADGLAAAARHADRRGTVGRP